MQKPRRRQNEDERMRAHNPCKQKSHDTRGFFVGAGRENRTLMTLRSQDFESCASTSSAIPAKWDYLTQSTAGRQYSHKSPVLADVALSSYLTVFAYTSTIVPTTYIAGWSSLAARRAHNPEVVGSSPTPATIKKPRHTRVFYVLSKRSAPKDSVVIVARPNIA